MANKQPKYFKCPCGKELGLHPKLVTNCSCGKSYWRMKKDNKLYALEIYSPEIEDNFKEITIPAYEKPVLSGAEGQSDESDKSDKSTQ